MFDASYIAFRRLASTDLPLLHHWLNHTPEANAFYADGQAVSYEWVEAKYGPRIRGESPTTPYLILYGGTPVGYIQNYLWRDYPDYAQHLDLHEEAGALDVFIGHPDYLHKGLGPLVLQGFLREVVFADPRVESCVITVEPRNTGALRAYAKAGFACLRIQNDLPDEPGPMWVLRIGRTCLG